MRIIEFIYIDPVTMSQVNLVLIIGKPVLFDNWQRPFLTRQVEPQQLFPAYDGHGYPYHVHAFHSPPFLDRQRAQQLADTYRPRSLRLFVSLLELDHRQCAEIMAGITILFGSWSDQMGRVLSLLEYERNPEHIDAVQQWQSMGTDNFFQDLVDNARESGTLTNIDGDLLKVENVDEN